MSDDLLVSVPLCPTCGEPEYKPCLTCGGECGSKWYHVHDDWMVVYVGSCRKIVGPEAARGKGEETVEHEAADVLFVLRRKLMDLNWQGKPPTPDPRVGELEQALVDMADSDHPCDRADILVAHGLPSSCNCGEHEK